MRSAVSRKSLRASLTASAVLATSVAAAVAGLAPAAHAAQGGVVGAELTISDGSSTVLVGGKAVAFPTSVTGAAWSPDSSRVAYIDDKGQVVTARADGSAPIVLAAAKSGVFRSGPTWISNGEAVAFTESSAAGQPGLLMAVAANPDGNATESDPISRLAQPDFPLGSESAADGNASSIVFQHHDAATNTDQIYIQDSFGRGTGGPKLIAAGTQPTVAPSGDKVAFAAKDGNGDQQIFVSSWDKNTGKAGAPVQVTFDPYNHVHPAWGDVRIAYEATAHGTGTPKDVESVAADGTAPNTPKVESDKPGIPAYQGTGVNYEVRLQGADRIGTAIAASQAAWPAPTSTNYHAGIVVLSRSDDFADALGGTTLAAANGGPLLLTPTAGLDAGVKAEIKRVLGPVDTAHPQTVYLLGGEKALSPAVETAVKALGYTVKRLGAADRYATAVAIAREVAGPNQPVRVLVATGQNYADALSAGAAADRFAGAGTRLGTIVLTDDKVMPAATKAYLDDIAHDREGVHTEVYGVGGQADKALTGVGVVHTGLVGADRYQTSYLVARTFFNGWNDFGSAPRSVGFATGTGWADALSGGAFMSKVNGPLLLVDPASDAAAGTSSADQRTWLSGWAPATTTAYVFGGPAAIPVANGNALANLISGVQSYTLVVNPVTNK